MIAYKFLRAGARGPFTGFAWPTPPSGDSPGEWVSGDGRRRPCASGVHACRVADLPIWLCDELWVAELEGPVTVARSKLVAARGRLIRRVAEWNAETASALSAACVRRAHEHAAGMPPASPQLAVAVGYASDAAALARAGGPAASVAYIAVRAAINAAGSPEGGKRERDWQAAWMRDRLSLDELARAAL